VRVTVDVPLLRIIWELPWWTLQQKYHIWLEKTRVGKISISFCWGGGAEAYKCKIGVLCELATGCKVFLLEIEGLKKKARLRKYGWMELEDEDKKDGQATMVCVLEH